MYSFKTKSGILRVEAVIASVMQEGVNGVQGNDLPFTDLVMYQHNEHTREIVLGCYEDHNRAIEATMIMGHGPKSLAVALRRAMTLASDLSPCDVKDLNNFLIENGVQPHKEKYINEIQESYAVGRIYTVCPSGNQVNVQEPGNRLTGK